MRCCWLNSQSAGIISALFARLYIDHKNYPIQSLSRVDITPVLKNLVWQSKYRFLRLTLNNHHNLIQFFFSISTCFIYLFVDSHLVVSLMEYFSYQTSTTISFCYMFLFPQVLWWEGTLFLNHWSFSLHFISHVSLPGIWLYYGLVSKFSSKILSQ